MYGRFLDRPERSLLSVVAASEVQSGFRLQLLRRSPGAPAVVGANYVQADGRQPSLHLVGTAVGSPGLEGAQIGLLNQVLGVLVVGGATPGAVVDEIHAREGVLEKVKVRSRHCYSEPRSHRFDCNQS